MISDCLFYYLYVQYFNTAADHPTKCKTTTNTDGGDARLNDVNYEFAASTAQTRNCDDVTDIEHDVRPLQNVGNTVKSAHESLATMPRQPRAMAHGPVNAAPPPAKQQHSASLAVAEERGQNPNGDIQDIITGIVKLLNGNVNVQNGAPVPPTRRYATRINNRGPPRISDLPPILPNIEEQFGPIHKTTPFPIIVRKPQVPYPFDLPDNMHTQLLPPAVPVNDYPIKMHANANGNKPTALPNRPPWHGNRTRQPIVGNPNRMHVPTRPALHHVTPPAAQDYRATINTANTMTPFYNRATDKYAITSGDEYADAPNASDDTQTEANRVPLHPESNRTVADPVSSKMPADLAAAADDKATTAPSGGDLNVPSNEFAELNLSRVTVPQDEEFHAITTSTTAAPTSSMDSFDPVTSTSSYAKVAATPELPYISSVQRSSVPHSPVRYTVNTSASQVTQTEPPASAIAPSKVLVTTHKIESTDFKSYYARPGIVLDDTIDFNRKNLHAGPPKTPPLAATNYHQVFEQDANVQSTASLSNIYAEIFDVTLSAIQGPGGGGAHKVVDLIEIENTGGPELRPTRVHANDIIVTASDDNSFVSIDGKRTYINLFGETAETEHLRKTNLATKAYTDYPQQTKPVSWEPIFGQIRRLFWRSIRKKFWLGRERSVDPLWNSTRCPPNGVPFINSLD